MLTRSVWKCTGKEVLEHSQREKMVCFYELNQNRDVAG